MATSTQTTASHAYRKERGQPGWRDLLLLCGLASSLLYVATDVVASLSYDGYSYRDQWVSELLASGAPSRQLMVALLIPYNVLMLAFAGGVWLTPGRRRLARITAGLIATYAIASQIGMFVPMDQRGAEETFRGSMHGPATAVMSLFTLLAMGFASRLLGRGFRWYTYATVAILIIFGVATSLYIPRLADNEPTPWMGIIERVNIYSQMLWTVVLAIGLVRLQQAELHSGVPS